MPQILPSPSGAGSSPWPQLTQPYQSQALPLGMAYLNSSQDRKFNSTQNDAQRELELKQAILGQAAGTVNMGTDGRAIVSGYAGQTGVHYQPNQTAGMQINNNAIEGGQAANAVQFGQAGANAVMGGAVPRATPYAYEGNIPAAMGVRDTTRNISGSGGTKPSIEYIAGGAGGKLHNSGQYKFKGADRNALEGLKGQYERTGQAAPEAEGAGGLTTPPPATGEGDDVLIQTFLEKFKGGVDETTAEIVSFGGKRVIMAIDINGNIVSAPITE